MLKKKSKVKLGGAVFLALLFCMSYVGISFYSVPEKAKATSWPLEARTLTDMVYLQEMNKDICDNSNIGDTNNSVKDSRDNNVYSIGKLADGKCWMTQNLRLTRETIQAKDPGNITGKITSGNTNLDSGFYEIPASTTGKFDDTKNGDYYVNQQVYTSENVNYGAFYSYNVATLNKVWNKGTGVTNNDICPKGWRLPTGGSGGEFQALYNKGNDKVGDFASGSLTSGYWLGGAVNTPDAAFFPAAGRIDGAGLYGIGSTGHYWSGMVYGITTAYIMDFSDNNVRPAAGHGGRSNGYSVRCIADERQLKTEYTDAASGSIAVKVANTLSIDAVSGMKEEVDSTSIASGTITATIAANTNYKVLLSAEKTSLTSANTTNTAEIPALSTVQAGTNAWGIRNSDNTTYSAITNQEKEYHNATTLSTNPNIPGTVHTFNIGISVSPSLPADTYSTEVTITAAAA